MNTALRKFLLQTFGNTLLISSLLILVLAWGPIIFDEGLYQWHKLLGQTYCLRQLSLGGNNCQQTANSKQQTAFGSLLGKVVNTSPILLEPVDRNFGLVIEKIGVNSPIIRDVSVSDPTAYNNALKNGVAQAYGTALPGDPRGNVYLFAHSSLNFWQLGKYATVFNLLRKLEPGDRAHVFYQNRDYVYQVISKEVVTGFNTYPLERRTIEPILTLQTCDPPGTTINRLVVTAKLIKIV